MSQQVFAGSANTIPFSSSSPFDIRLVFKQPTQWQFHWSLYTTVHARMFYRVSQTLPPLSTCNSTPYVNYPSNGSFSSFFRSFHHQ